MASGLRSQRGFTQSDVRRQRRPRGRPRKPGSGVCHLRRPSFHTWSALHVRLRVQSDVWSLRGAKLYRSIHRGLCGGNLRDGFRLVDYAVQRNHFHLLIEANTEAALARGMQGLAIRLARAVNHAMRRRGRVFCDRYRSRLIGDPLDARNTLRYVLNNARRHVRSAARNRTLWMDPCSSAPWFADWSIPPETRRFVPDQRHRAILALGNAAVPARTALLTHGWSRAGPIELLHVPGPVDAP